MNKKIFPPIGQRMLKSALGVFIGFLVYFARGCQGTPFYTALSVLWCMRPYAKECKGMAMQRSIGTLIGGLYGLLLIILESYADIALSDFWRYLVISIMIIPVLYTTVLLKRKNASYFACVVFLSITVLHMTDANPYLFVFNRMFDTWIGIIISLVINSVRIPMHKHKEILFISGIDDTLLSQDEHLTPYSLFELNTMLDEGANFTVSTMRTPASIVQILPDVHFKLPVIAMDGAVLFDIKKKRYLKKYTIDEEGANQLYHFFHQQNFCVFTNFIIDDLWSIYYQKFTNKVQSEIYEKLRVSPYRNYIHEEVKQFKNIVYFMLIDQTERLEKLYKQMQARGYDRNYKVLFYPSDDYKGYSYIKIYHKQATRQHMTEYLNEYLKTSRIVTFGSIEGKYDITIHENDSNKVVKTLKNLYEPYFWKKTS